MGGGIGDISLEELFNSLSRIQSRGDGNVERPQLGEMCRQSHDGAVHSGSGKWKDDEFGGINKNSPC